MGDELASLNREEKLARVPLFDGLSREALALVAAVASEETLARGKRLFSYGEVGDALSLYCAEALQHRRSGDKGGPQFGEHQAAEVRQRREQGDEGSRFQSGLFVTRAARHIVAIGYSFI